jgi:hypothetical protein
MAQDEVSSTAQEAHVTVFHSRFQPNRRSSLSLKSRCRRAVPDFLPLEAVTPRLPLCSYGITTQSWSRCRPRGHAATPPRWHSVPRALPARLLGCSAVRSPLLAQCSASILRCLWPSVVRGRPRVTRPCPPVILSLSLWWPDARSVSIFVFIVLKSFIREFLWTAFWLWMNEL